LQILEGRKNNETEESNLLGGQQENQENRKLEIPVRKIKNFLEETARRTLRELATSVETGGPLA